MPRRKRLKPPIQKRLSSRRNKKKSNPDDQDNKNESEGDNSKQYLESSEPQSSGIEFTLDEEEERNDGSDDDHNNSVLMQYSTPAKKGKLSSTKQRTTRRKSQRVRSRNARKGQKDEESSESDDSSLLDRKSRRKRTPSYIEIEEDEDEFTDRDEQNVMHSKKRAMIPSKKRNDEDEDEYNPDDDDDDDYDDDEGEENSEENDENANYSEDSIIEIITPKRSKQKRAKHRLSKNKEQINKRRRRKTTSLTFSSSSSSGEFEFDSDISEALDNIPLSQIRKNKTQSRTTPSPGNRPVCMNCPSKVDVITLLPLTKIHVCWIAPDKQSRQCFNLDTLKKVALSSTSAVFTHPTNATNASSTTTNNTIENDFSSSPPSRQRDYLQPPHFRTVMNDEMKDQIVAKFGREALNLNAWNSSGTNLQSEMDRQASFYNSSSNNNNNDSTPGYDFHDRLDRYIRKQMGSSDLYCCPLCYIEADRRLAMRQRGEILEMEEEEEEDEEEGDGEDGSDDEKQKKELYDEDLMEFDRDPMSILESFNDDFSTAASFCFRKVMEVKKHIRNVHDIDWTVLDGNALFHRFRIRDADGLLQRYLKNTTQQSYWAQGYSFDFMYLLHIVTIHTEIGSSINPNAYRFSKSFPRRARILWEVLSGPYLKFIDGEMDDYVVSEDQVEDEDVTSGEEDSAVLPPHRLSLSQESNEKEEDPDQIIIRELRRRRGKSSDISSGSESDEADVVIGKDDSDNDSIDDYTRNEIFKASEEDEEGLEEDEWMKKKKFTPKRNRKSGTISRELNSSPEIDMTSATNLNSHMDKSSSPETAVAKNGLGSAKKRRIYESGDEGI